MNLLQTKRGSKEESEHRFYAEIGQSIKEHNNTNLLKT